MINPFGKFSPILATIAQPMRELLGKITNWCWGTDQEVAFQAVNEELLKPTMLTLYNPKIKGSADALTFGLEAVLLQQDGTQ